MQHLVSLQEITNPVRTIGAHGERQRVKRVTERCSVRWNFGAGQSLRWRWTLTRQGGKFTPCDVIYQSLVFASTSLQNWATGLPLMVFSVLNARSTAASLSALWRRP